MSFVAPPGQDLDTHLRAVPRDAFHLDLREATRACHDEVDALFGQFDLGDRRDYGRFLTAHAKALVPVEDWAHCERLLPGWTGRKAALYHDLTALGLPMPGFSILSWPRDEAARWGATYVLEGSRLGGAVLSRSIGEGLPRAYLSATHAPGGWRKLLSAMEGRVEEGGEPWREAVIASARRTFTHYARAARDVIAR